MTKKLMGAMILGASAVTVVVWRCTKAAVKEKRRMQELMDFDAYGDDEYSDDEYPDEESDEYEDVLEEYKNSLFEYRDALEDLAGSLAQYRELLKARRELEDAMKEAEVLYHEGYE